MGQGARHGRGEVERLKRERDQLQEDFRHLEQLALVFQEKARKLRAELADPSMKPDAHWPWEPPMPAPKRMQGVYRLIREGRTVYIGQSTNIMHRVAEHASDKDFDQFSYALVDGGQETLNEVEGALIALLRPVGNKQQPQNVTGRPWTHEEAQAVLDKYGSRAVADDETAAA